MRAASEVLTTLLLVSLTVAAAAFVAWVVSGIIGSFVQVTGVASISGGEVSAVGNVAFIELTLSISGGISSLDAVRVWHNEQTVVATCLDCSTLFSQSYPTSRVDSLQLTVVATSSSQFSPGDFIRVEVEYTSGGVSRRTSGTLRV